MLALRQEGTERACPVYSLTFMDQLALVPLVSVMFRRHDSSAMAASCWHMWSHTESPRMKAQGMEKRKAIPSSRSNALYPHLS